MKKLVYVILALFFIPNVFGAIVTGGVEYNQEIAREEVFKTPLESISVNYIKEHLTDINYMANLRALSNGQTELSDRKLAKFSDGSYGIMYRENPLYSWYYMNGRLINFTQKSSESYPSKITKYKPDGSIVNTGIKVSEKESYIFSSDGRLIAHWLGPICFDDKDNVIMTRKYQK